MHMMHGYGIGSFWSMLLMIGFWIGLFSLGVYLLTNFITGGKKKPSPLEILHERLAKGEIDEDEYERLKTIIEQEDEHNKKQRL